jgi:hypothetical protein
MEVFYGVWIILILAISSAIKKSKNHLLGFIQSNGWI